MDNIVAKEEMTDQVARGQVIIELPSWIAASRVGMVTSLPLTITIASTECPTAASARFKQLVLVSKSMRSSAAVTGRADELRYYFHWKNIQLLRASDNRRKSRYVSAEEKQAKKDEIDGVSNSD